MTRMEVVAQILYENAARYPEILFTFDIWKEGLRIRGVTKPKQGIYQSAAYNHIILWDAVDEFSSTEFSHIIDHMATRLGVKDGD